MTTTTTTEPNPGALPKFSFKDYIRNNPQNSFIWLGIIVLCLYILLGMNSPLWMRGLVVVLLIFGGIQATSKKKKGKTSPLNDMRKAFQQAQKDYAPPQLKFQKPKI